MSRPLTATCGSLSGHTRHRRRGEEICDACRRAYNDYMREYQKVYRAKKKRESR